MKGSGHDRRLPEMFRTVSHPERASALQRCALALLPVSGGISRATSRHRARGCATRASIGRATRFESGRRATRRVALRERRGSASSGRGESGQSTAHRERHAERLAKDAGAPLRGQNPLTAAHAIDLDAAAEPVVVGPHPVLRTREGRDVAARFGSGAVGISDRSAHAEHQIFPRLPECEAAIGASEGERENAAGSSDVDIERRRRQASEDGQLAATLFLTGASRTTMAGAASDDPGLARLYAEKGGLEQAIAELRRRKASLTKGEYEDQLEELLVDLALTNRAIRDREGS